MCHEFVHDHYGFQVFRIFGTPIDLTGLSITVFYFDLAELDVVIGLLVVPDALDFLQEFFVAGNSFGSFGAHDKRFGLVLSFYGNIDT